MSAAPKDGPMPAMRRVTVLLLTYRQEAFVGAALDSLLAQDHPNMEILVRDDCSPDGTWDAIVARAAAHQGPHTLRIHRNTTNLGAHRSAWGGIEAAEGDFIIEAHGDDLFAPDRVRRMAELWEQTGASLISHNARVGETPAGPTRLMVPADQPTRQLTLEEVVGARWAETMLGASFGYEKRLWTTFGTLDPQRMGHAGDHLLPARAALLGGWWYLAAPLMFWRQHAAQTTAATCGLRDADPVAQAEFNGAHTLPALLQVRRDMARVMAGPEAEPGLATVRVQLDRRVALLVGAWARARTRLEGQGRSLGTPPARLGAVVGGGAPPAAGVVAVALRPPVVGEAGPALAAAVGVLRALGPVVETWVVGGPPLAGAPRLEVSGPTGNQVLRALAARSAAPLLMVARADTPGLRIQLDLVLALAKRPGVEAVVVGPPPPGAPPGTAAQRIGPGPIWSGAVDPERLVLRRELLSKVPDDNDVGEGVFGAVATAAAVARGLVRATHPALAGATAPAPGAVGAEATAAARLQQLAGSLEVLLRAGLVQGSPLEQSLHAAIIAGAEGWVAARRGLEEAEHPLHWA